MTDFIKIELSDKIWVDTLLRQSNYRGAEYCFTNLFVWSSVYQTKICRKDNLLLIRSGKEAYPLDFFPAGSGEIKPMIDMLLDTAKQEQRDFRMMVAGAEQTALLQQLYPALFTVIPARDSWDYIYKTEELSALHGKRYQSKRNHIARFIELPDWHYEQMTLQHIPECVQMNNIWCQLMGCADNRSLYAETCAMEIALQNFEALGLEGALLRVSDKIVAYTIGEPINSDTYIVHAEKAFPDIRGAYPMINREFIRDRASSFTYVNREDDAGDEGLRRAKNSYHPVFMQEKYFFAVSYNSLSLHR